MKKPVIWTLVLLLIGVLLEIHPGKTTAAGCGKTAFTIQLNEKADLKAKMDVSSKTKAKAAKGKKRAVIKRTGGWYQVCYKNQPVYVKAAQAKEIFSSDEKHILNKALESGSKQVLLAAGSKQSSTAVTLHPYGYKYGGWRRALHTMDGVIGKNGFTVNKKEGDKKTPIGIYSFGTAFGSSKPAHLDWPFKKAGADDYWVDDTSSRDYNKWVHYTGSPDKRWQSYERMNHPLYKYGIVIEYNTSPIIKGRGSAIFLHIWRGKGTYTSGCTAISEKNLLTVLKWLDPKLDPEIVLSPAAYMKKL